MSNKLTRYKKGPSVKLPKFLPKKEKETSIFDDSDDDDFLSKPLSIIGTLTRGKNSAVKAKTTETRVPASTISSDASDSDNDTCSTSSAKQSKYFRNTKKSKETQEKPQANLESAEEKAILSGKTKIKPPAILPSVEEENQSKEESNDIPEDNPINGLVDNVPFQDNKVVCPFCWKRLNDKLTGTTHIKSCAKNLPTNQIFEALQLQEKQIKEWEELGVAYPGFIGNPGTGAGGRKGRSGAVAGSSKAPRTNRRKKQDPELELAIALSASLHEEVKRRQNNEKVFIIENGLEKVVNLNYETNSKTANENDNTKIQISKTVVEMTANNRNKKRGKKGNIADLPLYKVTETERKAVVEQRLSKILDENESKTSSNQFNVRSPIPVGSLKSSARISAYVAESPKLWSTAGSEVAEKEKFVTQVVADCKEKNKIENPTIKSESESEKLSLNQCPRSIINSIEVENTVSTKSSYFRLTSGHCKSGAGDYALQNSSSRKADSSSKRCEHSSTNKSSSTVGQSSQSSSVSKVAQDLLALYVSKEDSDLTLYGREEKPIRCHKLIVKARCPKLLKEIAVETSLSGSKKPIIPLTCYSHVAVKAFAKFIYCGRLSAQIKGQDLEDIKELSEKYELTIDFDSSSGKSTPTTDAQIQTEDDFALQSSETPIFKTKSDRLRSIAVSKKSLDLFERWSQDVCKEPEENPVTRAASPLNNNFGVSGDEDLFCDIDEEEYFSPKASKPDPENKPSITRISEDSEVDDDESGNGNNNKSKNTNISNENQDGSRDLFEDDIDAEEENEQGRNESEVSEKGIQSHTICLGNKSQETSGTPEQQNRKDLFDYNDILEDELCTQVGTPILLSPKPYKRSRSLSPNRSPSSFTSSQQYTATQMAEYLELKELGKIPPDSPDTHQAKKKHKLDVENSNIERDDGKNNSNVSVTVIECSLSRDTCLASSKFDHLRKDSFGTFENVQNLGVSCSDRDTTISNKPSVSVSPLPNISAFSPWNTPKLSNTANSPVNLNVLQNPNNVSPILPQQNAEFNDPFGSGMDDSCFANLPSILLQGSNEISVVQNFDRPQNTSTPLTYPSNPTPLRIPSQTLRKGKQGRLSQKQRLEFENVETNDLALEKKKQSKGRCKKNTANVSLSQGNNPTTNNTVQKPGNPIQAHLQQQDPGNSLLNYSTVDTPILKQELKRYGLKPLPRSKAKVILRHIYSETHKDCKS